MMTDVPTERLALEAELFAFLQFKYVQRADDRQREMDLIYTEAETHDLAKVIAGFILSHRSSPAPAEVTEAMVERAVEAAAASMYTPEFDAADASNNARVEIMVRAALTAAPPESDSRKHIVAAEAAVPAGVPVAWLDMRNEPAADWTERVVATNPDYVKNNGAENFVALGRLSPAPTETAQSRDEVLAWWIAIDGDMRPETEHHIFIDYDDATAYVAIQQAEHLGSRYEIHPLTTPKHAGGGK